MEVAEQVELKVPKLRFREFEGLLTERPLGEVATWKSGGTPPKDVPQYWEGDLPWISASEMRGKFYSTSQYGISEEGLRKGSKLAIKGSLLLLTRGSMLFNKIPVGITSVDVAFNQDIKSLNPVKGVDLEFLYQWFCFKEHRLMNLVGGTGIGAGKLDTTELKSIILNLPTHPEQQKIAGFLSAVDDKLQHLNRKKELLQQYKKGVMQKLFSQELRFKREDGSDYEDWEEKRLGELGTFRGGGTPSTEVPEYWQGEIPWVSSSDIIENDVRRIATTRFISEAAVQESAAKIVPPDSLLFVARVGVGKLAVSDRPLTTSQDFANFTPYEASGLFLAYFFLANNHELKRYAQGTSIQGFTTTDLKAVTVQLPCPEEQQKIADFLSSLDEKIDAVSAQIELTQQFKKGLLQEMFV